MVSEIQKEDENLSLNFICPICKKEIKDDEGDDTTFDGEKQFYHISCLKSKDNEIQFEKQNEDI